MFKVSYNGENGKKVGLKYGEVYGVENEIRDLDGKKFFTLEGKSGKYEESDFLKLESKGFHYLSGQKIPKLGSCMRLVKNKSDIYEFLSGEVKEVESTVIEGRYRVCTRKCIYDVEAIS